MQRLACAQASQTPRLTQWMLHKRHFDNLPHAWRFLRTSLATLLFFSLLGCSPPVIKGTDLPDTKYNKEIYNVIMDYQQAFQKGQWNSLLKLISPRYLETKGTPDPDDDYGYEALKAKILSKEFQQIKVYRFYVRVEKIEYPTANEAIATLITRTVYQYPRGQYQPGWDRGISKHRMRLEYYQGRWLITRGL